MFRKYISPLTGKPATKESIEESLVIFARSLKLLETYWLANTPYLNSDQPTIADISAACELAQTTTLLLFVDNPKKFPKVYAWLERMLAMPGMKEIHDKTLPFMAKFFKKMDEQNQAKL